MSRLEAWLFDEGNHRFSIGVTRHLAVGHSRSHNAGSYLFRAQTVAEAMRIADDYIQRVKTKKDSRVQRYFSTGMMTDDHRVYRGKNGKWYGTDVSGKRF